MNKHRFGKASGCEVTSEMMERLHHPEEKLRVIHIAGTNGKGSTAAFVSSILRAAGFCVGTFTSPHLVDFCERITVDGKWIERENAARLGEYLLDLEMDLEPTMFDYCLAMAILYFGERNVDFVVLETGLGGAKDSTNGLSIVPEVSIFTSIGLDHTEILGDSLPQIALEKAGILKAGSHAIISHMEEEAASVIRNRCRELNVPYTDLSNGFDALETGGWLSPESLAEIRSEKLGLSGKYQTYNAMAALAGCLVLRKHGIEILDDAIKMGLSNAKWAGRMQVLSEKPYFLVDGAHNPEGVKALADSLVGIFPGEKFLLLAGVLADKDYESMMERMLPLADSVYTVTVESKRTLQGEELAKWFKEQGHAAKAYQSLQTAIIDAREEALEKDLRIVAFGSLYFVGEILSFMQDLANN